MDRNWRCTFDCVEVVQNWDALSIDWLFSGQCISIFCHIPLEHHCSFQLISFSFRLLHFQSIWSETRNSQSHNEFRFGVKLHRIKIPLSVITLNHIETATIPTQVQLYNNPYPPQQKKGYHERRNSILFSFLKCSQFIQHLAVRFIVSTYSNKTIIKRMIMSTLYIPGCDTSCSDWAKLRNGCTVT